MGIVIKKYKKLEKNKLVMVKGLNIEFKDLNIKEYIINFKKLKEQNKIIDGDFKDNKWTLLLTGGKSEILFTKISIDKNIILAIKVYTVILLLNEDKSPITVNEHLRAIEYIIKTTYNLDLEYLEEFKDSIEETYQNKSEINKLYNITRLGKRFLRFYDNNLMKPIIDVLNNYNIVKLFKNREIASFQSTIWFNEIINDYYSKTSKANKERYFIIYLWWTITTNIPMRPSEFLEIRRECLRAENGKYYLIIPNNKKKNFREVSITKSIYNLIIEYKELNKNNESYFLFDYDDFRKTFNNNRNQNTILKEYHNNKIGGYRFESRLNDFYGNVIEKEYGIKVINKNMKDRNDNELYIEKIAIGDTRHFAVCNLYLQGHNPLTIARLAGHDLMNTQLGYANHMNYFAQSSVKVLTDIFKKYKILDSGRSSDFFSNSIRKDIINSNKIKSDYLIIGNVKCKDKDFPNNCITDCDECDFKIKDNKNQYKLQSDKYKNKIDKEIDIMKNIIKNTALYDKVERNRNFDVEDQFIFGSSSKRLQSLIYKKALSDYQIFKKECIE